MNIVGILRMILIFLHLKKISGGFMKKNIFLVLLIIFISGCSRTMKCNLHIDNNKFSVDKNYKVKYSGKNIIDVNVFEKYVVNDDFLNTFDNMFIYIKGQYEGFNIPYTVDIKDNTYVLKSNFSSDILTDEAIQDLLGENNISSYKSKLEESGFKCK